MSEPRKRKPPLRNRTLRIELTSKEPDDLQAHLEAVMKAIPDARDVDVRVHSWPDTELERKATDAAEDHLREQNEEKTEPARSAVKQSDPAADTAGNDGGLEPASDGKHERFYHRLGAWIQAGWYITVRALVDSQAR